MKKIQIYVSLLLLTFSIPNCAKAQTASITSSLDTLCQDSCTTFTNTSTGHIDSLKWFIRDVGFTNLDSNTISACFPANGYDTVWLYTFDSGIADTVSFIISIKPKPHPKIIDSPFCCSVSGSYQSYQWCKYFVYADPISGATDSSYESLSFGGYCVLVDSDGCMGYSDTVHVLEAVNNLSSVSYKIAVWPNPVTNVAVFNYQITRSANLRLSILNSLGQKVAEFPLKNGSGQQIWDVGVRPSGVYFYRFIGDSGLIADGKVFVSN